MALVAPFALATSMTAIKSIKSLQVEEKRLSLSAEAEEVGAKKSYSNIEIAATALQAEELSAQAMKHQLDAMNFRIDALKNRHEQELMRSKFSEADKLRQLVELENLKVYEMEKYKIFVAKVVQLEWEIKKRVDPVEIRIREQRRKIDEARLNGSDKIFDAQQRVREVELEMLRENK